MFSQNKFNIIMIYFICGFEISFSGTTGKITGFVFDEKSEIPLIGVNVMVGNTNLGSATNIEGYYFILQVPPGEYSLKFSMIGYQTVIINDIRVKVDLTTKINAKMKESVVGMEEIVVQADRPMIQTDVTYSQANISSEEVDMLPVEEFQDVLSLQAGVVTAGGEIHVRGGRGGEISYMVDGITVTDPYNSDLAIEIENNSIQELQFISGTFNAEYGQAMSGIVNIVTKDGDFHKRKWNISTHLGDYIIRKDKIFPGTNKVNWNNIYDYRGSFEGPVVQGKISFFLSGRWKVNRGYINGERVFHPNSYLWSDTQNMFVIDPNIGLGDGSTPNDNNWNSLDYQDSLRSQIDKKRISGDFQSISMNWSEQTTYQSKLSWRFNPKIRIGYNRMFSDNVSQSYDHLYRWNPDGRPYSFNTRVGDIFRFDISVNQSTFVNLMFSRALNHYRTHLSNDPNYIDRVNDYIYNNTEPDIWNFDILDTNLYDIDPRVLDYATGNNFEVGGNYMGIYNRKSNVKTAKVELTSQFNSNHQFKLGGEIRETKIYFNDITVLQTAFTEYYPVILEPANNTIHNSFQSMINPFSGQELDNRSPIEFSFYVQDKMESEDFIVNIGLRYDHFDSRFWVLNDYEDPNYLSPLKPINKWIDSNGDGSISEVEMSNDNLKTDSMRLASNANGIPWYRRANPKKQVSPRFALAFPITDKGYIHFSYGHFFQNPNMSYIYDNPEFEVPAASGVNSTMGNADMEPQRTTQYEVGFSQQFGKDMALEFTGYFKDIRNLNATEIKNSFIAGDRYGMYINKDHASSKGITIAFSKRSRKRISGNLDYTYSISEGNASDPTSAFYDEQSDIEPEKLLVPLDWDQRHTINATVTAKIKKNASLSTVFNYGSGFPYTSTNLDGQRTSFENNGRKPSTFNVDMRAFYEIFSFKSFNISASLNIYNLLDIRNELTVYGDTGRSSYSLLPTYTPQYSGPMLNNLDEFLIRPSYYSAPRQIKFGVSIAFN